MVADRRISMIFSADMREGKGQKDKTTSEMKIKVDNSSLYIPTNYNPPISSTSELVIMNEEGWEPTAGWAELPVTMLYNHLQWLAKQGKGP